MQNLFSNIKLIKSDVILFKSYIMQQMTKCINKVYIFFLLTELNTL